MTELDKIALEVAHELWCAGVMYIGPGENTVTEFARRLVAKLSEWQEPAGEVDQVDVSDESNIYASVRLEYPVKLGAQLYLHPPLTADTRTLDALRQCRSSVRFDLLRYEKMARAYGNLGPEGQQKHEVAEAEANRLHKLLDEIDAITWKENNA